MKRLQVLGTGCPKCKTLAERTEEAAKAAGIEYELEKVTEMDRILALGVMMTPALVVDDEVKLMGKLASVEEIRSLIS